MPFGRMPRQWAGSTAFARPQESICTPSSAMAISDEAPGKIIGLQC